MIATVVEWAELGETVLASVVAGIGVTAVFSIGIWGVARSTDLSRDERPAAASMAALVAFLGLAATVAMVVVGAIVMTSS